MGYASLAKAFCATSEDAGWGWKEEEVTDFLTKHKPETFQDVVELISSEYARKCGDEKFVFGIKRPMLIFYLKELQRIFPSSPIIHLVRDGRDVCLSYKVVHQKLDSPFGPNGVVTSALYWSVGLAELAKADRRVNILEIRYEDLLEQSEATLEIVCDRLGIAFCKDEMLGYARKRGASEIVLEKDKVGHHSNVLKGLMGKNHEKYRTEMSLWERWLFEFLAGNWLRRYGYQTEVPKVVDFFFSFPRYVLHSMALAFNRVRYRRREKKLQDDWSNAN